MKYGFYRRWDPTTKAARSNRKQDWWQNLTWADVGRYAYCAFLLVMPAVAMVIFWQVSLDKGLIPYVADDWDGYASYEKRPSSFLAVVNPILILAQAGAYSFVQRYWRYEKVIRELRQSNRRLIAELRNAERR